MLSYLRPVDVDSSLRRDPHAPGCAGARAPAGRAGPPAELPVVHPPVAGLRHVFRHDSPANARQRHTVPHHAPAPASRMARGLRGGRVHPAEAGRVLGRVAPPALPPVRLPAAGSGSPQETAQQLRVLRVLPEAGGRRRHCRSYEEEEACPAWSAWAPPAAAAPPPTPPSSSAAGTACAWRARAAAWPPGRC